MALPAVTKEFQSTLPVWGATPGFAGAALAGDISIHAPRVGSDWISAENCVALKQFQSTLPVWGATGNIGFCCVELPISIHAPRVGSDSPPPPGSLPLQYFNPRSPCGERLCLGLTNDAPDNFNPRSPCGERPRRTVQLHLDMLFQSTLPVWGATGKQEL